MNNTITSSRKYLIPDNTCKVNNLAQKKLYTKPNHKVTHQNIVTLIRMNYHFIVGGGGQGSGNRKSLWSFIGILLMEVKYKIVPGCTINPPSSDKILKLKMLGFVDDKRHYVNLILQHIKESLKEAMSKSVNMQEELLSFVGGKLIMSKCGFYVLQWEFDSNGKYFFKEISQQSVSQVRV